VYGQIAAANAMSDVYAMGGEVKLALNIAAFPEDLDPAILAEIFRGGAEKVAEAGGVVAGGHTILDEEPKYGLSVTGVAHPAAIIRTAGAVPGDALVLTKPIGTGVVMTAAQQRMEGHEAALEAAVESMSRLSRHAAHLARTAGVHAMTDVTGFGLLGHAAEMAERSDVTVVIEAGAVPLLPGAYEFAAAGAITGGGGRNLAGLQQQVAHAEDVEDTVLDLLYDPQTSGGLLIAVPPENADSLCEQIEAQEGGCWRIGTIEEGDPIVDVR
jgi:selenide,water dikinase